MPDSEARASSAQSWGTLQYLGLAGAFLGSLALSAKILVESFTADHRLFGAFFPLFGLALGGFGVWKGFESLREKLLVEGTPTSTVASLAVGDVELEGQAWPVEEPARAPLTHKEACLYELQVEELQSSGNSPSWVTVFSLTDHVPFEVDDGTGSVRVDPEGADLQLETGYQVQTDGGEPPPESVRRWAMEQGHVDPQQVDEEGGLREALHDTVSAIGDSDAELHLAGTSLRCRRYTEKVLAAGESAYVFGGARPREGADSRENPENLVITNHEGTGKFILSDGSEAGVLRNRNFGIAVTFVSAGLLVPASIVGLLALAGLV